MLLSFSSRPIEPSTNNDSSFTKRLALCLYMYVVEFGALLLLLLDTLCVENPMLGYVRLIYKKICTRVECRQRAERLTYKKLDRSRLNSENGLRACG